MKKSTASTSEWPAIACAGVLAPFVVAGVWNMLTSTENPSTPREAYDLQYERCVEDTGYRLEKAIWADASHKRRIGTQYIANLAVTSGNEVTIIPGGEDQREPSLNFIFKQVDGIHELVPSDDFTRTFSDAC